MNAFNNHLLLKDVMESRQISKSEIVALGVTGVLPLAVWAKGYFIWEGQKSDEDGRFHGTGSNRLSDGEWLYLDPSYLPLFLSIDSVGMGNFRSGVESPIDRWATLKNEQKPHVSMEMLWIPEISLGNLPTYDIRPEIGDITSNRSDTHSPNWILRKMSGDRWQVGEESNFETFSHSNGFADFAYVIVAAEEKDITPLMLPGSRTEESDNLPKGVATTPSSNVHMGGFPGGDEEPPTWTGFGSDNYADPAAARQYQRAGDNLHEEIDAAIETGNESAEGDARSRLVELEHYINETTMPGGKPRKITTGDPIERATSNARERKRHIVKKLKNAGLDQIAAYIDDSYSIRKRTVSYVPRQPFPNWLLD